MRSIQHAVFIIIIIIWRHLFGVHALSDGAEVTCLIWSVIVYTTHSRGDVVTKYHQTLKLLCVSPSGGSDPDHSIPSVVLFRTFVCEIDVFCGEQTLTTWFLHTMLLPRSRAHPCSIYPQITPTMLTYRCCDLRKKAKGFTNGCRSVWRGLFLPHTPQGLPISLRAIWSYCGLCGHACGLCSKWWGVLAFVSCLWCPVFVCL